MLRLPIPYMYTMNTARSYTMQNSTAAVISPYFMSQILYAHNKIPDLTLCFAGEELKKVKKKGGLRRKRPSSYLVLVF